jgi:hypothetical protein
MPGSHLSPGRFNDRAPRQLPLRPHQFEVEGAIDSALSCNCSICLRKGSLLWFVPRASLRLQTPESDTASYTFNKHVIQHRFCPTCGIHPYGDAVAAVNIRCIEGIDLAAVPVHHFDGRSK